jgi:hypothetical protein
VSNTEETRRIAQGLAAYAKKLLQDGGRLFGPYARSDFHLVI